MTFDPPVMRVGGVIASQMGHGQPSPRFGPPDAVIARGLTARAPGGGWRPTSRPSSPARSLPLRGPLHPLELLLVLIVVAILAPGSHLRTPGSRGDAESRLAAIVTVA
jgi:hypothetical protein